MKGKNKHQPNGTPFEEGERAAQAGQTTLTNPYRSGSIEHQRWRSGWNYATLRQAQAAKKKAA